MGEIIIDAGQALRILTKVLISNDIKSLSMSFDDMLYEVSEGKQTVALRKAACSTKKDKQTATNQPPPFIVKEDIFTKCYLCLDAFPCPAFVQFEPNGYPSIIPDIFTGSGNCIDICKYSPDPTNLRKGRTAVVPCH